MRAIELATAHLRHPRVVTFGTFDVFHVGHLSILERARAHGANLTVGVSTDRLNLAKKGRAPIYPEHERRRIIDALQCVDATFLEESLEDKRAYLETAGADVLVMGGDRRPLRPPERHLPGGLPASDAVHLHHRDHRADPRRPPLMLTPDHISKRTRGGGGPRRGRGPAWPGPRTSRS